MLTCDHSLAHAAYMYWLVRDHKRRARLAGGGAHYDLAQGDLDGVRELVRMHRRKKSCSCTVKFSIASLRIRRLRGHADGVRTRRKQGRKRVGGGFVDGAVNIHGACN